MQGTIEVIRCRADLERVWAQIDQVWDSSLESLEGHTLRVLARLADSYEEKHAALPSRGEMVEEDLTLSLAPIWEGIPRPTTVERWPGKFVAWWGQEVCGTGATEAEALNRMMHGILDFGKELAALPDEVLGPTLLQIKQGFDCYRSLMK